MWSLYQSETSGTIPISCFNRRRHYSFPRTGNSYCCLANNPVLLLKWGPIRDCRIIFEHKELTLDFSTNSSPTICEVPRSIISGNAPVMFLPWSLLLLLYLPTTPRKKSCFKKIAYLSSGCNKTNWYKLVPISANTHSSQFLWKCFYILFYFFT